MRADPAVMISAAQPVRGQRIKLFGPQGFKLSDRGRNQIEQLLDESLDKRLRRAQPRNRPPHRRCA